MEEDKIAGKLVYSYGFCDKLIGWVINFWCGGIAVSGVCVCIEFACSPHVYMGSLRVQLEAYLGYYPVGALGLMSWWRSGLWSPRRCSAAGRRSLGRGWGQLQRAGFTECAAAEVFSPLLGWFFFFTATGSWIWSKRRRPLVFLKQTCRALWSPAETKGPF